VNQIEEEATDLWIQKEDLECFPHHIHILYQNMYRMILMYEAAKSEQKSFLAFSSLQSYGQTSLDR
jgi:hypothetical protein